MQFTHSHADAHESHTSTTTARAAWPGSSVIPARGPPAARAAAVSSRTTFTSSEYDQRAASCERRRASRERDTAPRSIPEASSPHTGPSSIGIIIIIII